MSTKKLLGQLYVSLRLKDPIQKKMVAVINRMIRAEDKDAAGIIFEALCERYKIKATPKRRPPAVVNGGVQVRLGLFDDPIHRRILERFEAEQKRTGLGQGDLLRQIMQEHLI